MENYSQKELDAALQLISSTIDKCEKMQLKFGEGTSQYSLLKNRIKALYISKDLIENDSNIGMYTQPDLEKALAPVLSIINKTEKAQIKYGEGTVQYRRFDPIISAMYISKVFIENEISKRTQ
ncbi:hypothetical protein [Anaerocolumna xylanovorans]|uniref:Uncharacterized protein n=1 Tax=Anaerocolumna xylanovorans DSM 12503 TaxID=1121345 RepID=A0A1M7YIM1_9FIRM|nr:hypothetical protein [Anaerocolumna xylanovorans]SHO52449.1 hypothetical protein SAMN02745217_03659 [Anaerocolumna xylanovorans DSM 12503]